MPGTTFTTKPGYLNAAIDTPDFLGYRKTYPYLQHGVTGAVKLHITFMQREGKFVPAVPGSRLTLSGDLLTDSELAGKDFFLLEETQPERLPARNLVKWVRVYGNIPDSFEIVESIPFTFPGLAGGTEPPTPIVPSAVVQQQNGTVITAVHAMDINDAVIIYVHITVSTFKAQWWVRRTVLEDIGPNTGIRVAPITFIDVRNGATNTYFPTIDALVPIPTTRNARSLPAVGFVRHDFFQTDEPEKVELLPAFKAVTIAANGAEVEILTGSTFPTSTTFLSWIETGERIVAQESLLERYGGDIYIRKTVYVTAR